MDGVTVDAEQFGGLSDRQIVLAVLCALCAVLSHGPMLDPSEATRKPSEANLARLEGNEKPPAVAQGGYLPTNPPGSSDTRSSRPVAHGLRDDPRGCVLRISARSGGRAPSSVLQARRVA